MKATLCVCAYLVIAPCRLIRPRKIVRLRIIMTQYNVFAVNHLLNLGERNTIALRTECNNALHQIQMKLHNGNYDYCWVTFMCRLQRTQMNMI